jgi:hypothetical protein
MSERDEIVEAFRIPGLDGEFWIDQFSALFAEKPWLANALLERAGWKAAPMEPTVGMYGALMKNWEGTDAGKLAIAQWLFGTFSEDYRAMLAAAPSGPEQG